MDKIEFTGAYACSCLLCHSAYEVAFLDSTACTSHVVMSAQLSWGKLAAQQINTLLSEQPLGNNQ
jgi:hypothetical protein